MSQGLRLCSPHFAASITSRVWHSHADWTTGWWHSPGLSIVGQWAIYLQNVAHFFCENLSMSTKHFKVETYHKMSKGLTLNCEINKLSERGKQSSPHRVAPLWCKLHGHCFLPPGPSPWKRNTLCCHLGLHCQGSYKNLQILVLDK